MRFQCQGPALPHVSAEMAYDGKQVQRARAAVARTINAAPEEVMLNECCAVGVNYVACGIDWREGVGVGGGEGVGEGGDGRPSASSRRLTVGL